MNPLIERIYETRAVEDSAGNRLNPFPAAIPYETGGLLYRFVLEQKLDRTLEVGMAYGLSTLFICQAHADKGTGYHVAIDPIQAKYWHSIGVLNVHRSGLERWFRLIEERSDVALPQLVAEKQQIDFAFIDGNHVFDYVLVDFFFIDKLLRTGGYIAFDDVWMPAVRRVVSFVLSNRAYEAVTVDEAGADGIRRRRYWKRKARLIGRFVRRPFDRDPVRRKFGAKNCLLARKVADDGRAWDFHRPF